MKKLERAMQRIKKVKLKSIPSNKNKKKERKKEK